MIDYNTYEVATVITYWQVAQIVVLFVVYGYGIQKFFTLDS